MCLTSIVSIGAIFLISLMVNISTHDASQTDEMKTMQLILNVITVFAFVLSIVNLIERFYKNRLSFNCEVLYFTSTRAHCRICFIIENKSMLPLTITRLKIKQANDVFVDALAHSTILESQKRSNLPITVLYNTLLPKIVAALNAERLELVFKPTDDTLLTPSKPLIVEISTIQGKTIRRLTLPSMDYLRLRKP